MPLLITGPPGSSTTEAALERFHARPGSLLLVPTATMADHLRHSLVRSGVVIRPSSIKTLAAFLDEWSPLSAAPAPFVQLCMERALARVRPARFLPVAEFPGVVRELASLFGEISGKRMPDDVGRLFGDVERQLATKNMAPRHARLAAAAARINQDNEPLPPHIVFDGFFKLSAGESALVAALSARTELTITLPEWSGAERAREGMGHFDELRVTPPPSAAHTTLVTAATMEREVEEIARRILDETSQGRRLFRDVGIVLRARDPYGPLVETTLARFGIPARAYFIDPLASHPAVQFRSTMIRSALNGWDHEQLLTALRMTASGLGATTVGDARDFEMRKRLPGRGWGGLLTGDPATALKRTREWMPDLEVEDHADHARVSAWRSTTAAMTGFDAAIDAASQAFAPAFEGEDHIGLPTFWRHVERALSQEPLRVNDARRNVVHILDAYEARQWALPLVFVPGLIERHFPQYHREDPIVGDAALRRAGLDTKPDREREEKFLYELATTRATEETILSYPRFDQSGQSSLQSFFLPTSIPVTTSTPFTTSIPVSEPRPLGSGPVPTNHPTLSASSIESYLQCPFQFFTRKTLRLTKRPDPPRDRLNPLVQGSILHHALAEWTRLPLLGTSILDQAFEEACAKEHVPHTYRTEAVRLELFRHFEAFIRDQQVDLGWQARVEESFEFPLNGAVSLRGRIDRMDVSLTGQALVIDYKYSAAARLKERIDDSASGDAVQAGIYLLAAERAFGLKPAGMLFCHMKKGVKWDGWHADLNLSAGERRTPEGVRELALLAEKTVLRVHEEISSGRVAVQPKDESKCAWCEARDVCRVESLERVKTAAGA